MTTGMSGVEMRKMLDWSCTSHEGMVITDPKGECQRVHDLFESANQ